MVATTWSLGIASARARPITTVPPTASAFAVVVDFAVCVTVRLMASPAVSEAPVPIEAVVMTVGSAIEASAVRPRVEPEGLSTPASA